ncbi:MAG: hypothetical protein Q4C44_00840 [bacterium]|nr:hypothetical protein [bacterium]
MEEELLSLIFDYSINRKIADNAFCDRLLEIVLNHRELHDFVKDAYYIRGEEGTKTDKTAAYYMSVDRSIVVDFDNIESKLNYLKLVDPKFNELEVYLIRNIIIARTLLHELEHANQIKKVATGQNGLDACILELSPIYINLKSTLDLLNRGLSREEAESIVEPLKDQYLKFYKSDPSERMAEIDSYKTTNSILNMINKPIPQVRRHQNSELAYTLLDGYKESTDIFPNAPTLNNLYYFGSLNRLSIAGYTIKDFREFFTAISAMSLDKRLYYGLTISNGEYEAIMDSAIRSNIFR